MMQTMNKINMKTIKYILNSEKQTREVAEKFSKAISLPLIVGLKGDLGVGKTAFIRSFIKLYNKDEKVKSPTFSLVEEYIYDKISIFHADLYRIKKNEKYYLNLEDYQSKNSLILIEWIDNDQKFVACSDIIININILEKIDQRDIQFSSFSEKGEEVIKNIENAFKT